MAFGAWLLFFPLDGGPVAVEGPICAHVDPGAAFRVRVPAQPAFAVGCEPRTALVATAAPRFAFLVSCVPRRC